VAVTNPNGKTVRTSYDALGRITQITTPLGFITQFAVSRPPVRQAFLNSCAPDFSRF